MSTEITVCEGSGSPNCQHFHKERPETVYIFAESDKATTDSLDKLMSVNGCYIANCPDCDDFQSVSDSAPAAQMARIEHIKIKHGYLSEG